MTTDRPASHFDYYDPIPQDALPLGTAAPETVRAEAVTLINREYLFCVPKPSAPSWLGWVAALLAVLVIGVVIGRYVRPPKI